MSFHRNFPVFFAKSSLVWFSVVFLLVFFSHSARANLTFTFTSSTGYAVSGSNLSVGGKLNLSLGFKPTPGTNLTVARNTGLPFISGTFDGVPQGGGVPLTYNGVTYNYIANYYGGNGRSLVLQWPCMGLVAWGDNSFGQLGNSGTTSSSVPVAVNMSGALFGKTILSIARGSVAAHSMALTSDGQIFAWGYNLFGELGNSGTTNSAVPVAVNMNGALAGKIVGAIAVGQLHSLALTSDGQVFAWGANNYGQLGTGGTTDSPVPVAVNAIGALAGKTVVAIAAGGGHSLALTADGQVYAWGYNLDGELGNNSTLNSFVPVAVETTGALAGKTVAAIAGGCFHNLALTTDGQVFAWGANAYGELGNSGTANSLAPVVVNTSGVLNGKIVVAIVGGFLHSLALTADGQAVAWGYNGSGELGNSGTTNSSVPVAVNTGGVLAGKTVTEIAAGGNHSLALTADGQAVTWGGNGSGELGNNSNTDSSVPVAVNTSGVLAGKPVAAIAGGGAQSLALFGSGTPSISVNPSNQTGTVGATVSFVASIANDDPAPVIQWQVSAMGTAGPFVDIDTVANPSAATGTLSLADVTLAQNGYAYQAVFTNLAGSATTNPSTLSVVPSIPVLNVPADISVNATDQNGAIAYFNVTGSDAVDGALTPVCSASSGAVFPIGTTTVNCSVTNSSNVTVSGSFTVTVSRSYAWFQSLYGLSSVTDITADTYGTGVSALEGYAFDVNPAAPDRSQLPFVAVQGGYLQISFPQWIDSADLSYIVEVSGDMIHWNSGSGYTQQFSVSPIDSTRQQVVVSDLLPITNAVHRFIRVKIVK